MKKTHKKSKFVETKYLNLKQSPVEQTLKNIEIEALATIKKASSPETLKEIEVEYLGRKGKLTHLLRGLKDLPKEQKPFFGKLSNEIKTNVERSFANKLQELENQKLKKDLSQEFFDTTIPAKKRKVGHIHPIYKIQEEVEQIFNNMGFSIMDGPEVESEYYNFETLNIPKNHPARDMQDTFFLQDKDDEKHGRFVLRTHTSPVQVRAMEKYGAPLRIIIPGRVFRYEATDASHDSTFDQVEGLLIGKDVSLSHLKGIMAEMLSTLFNADVKVRFRPGYFPFVEPGLELDFSCLLCEGIGCKACKNTGWMEFMGAGMVHKNVLKAGGVDPEEYQGWAFGFGLTRLAMMKHLIPDIRLISSGDIRFTRQFN